MEVTGVKHNVMNKNYIIWSGELCDIAYTSFAILQIYNRITDITRNNKQITDWLCRWANSSPSQTETIK